MSFCKLFKNYNTDFTIKQYILTKKLKKQLNDEFLHYVNLKEKIEIEKQEKIIEEQKLAQFYKVLDNSLQGCCTICCEEMNFIENTNYNCVLKCLINKHKCFNNFAPIVFDCGHVYHYNCIEKWFTYSNNQMCPNCGI